MKRKIVSFCEGAGEFYAVADDGTIWRRVRDGWEQSSRFPPLPDAPNPQPSPDSAPAFKVGDVVIHKMDDTSNYRIERIKMECRTSRGYLLVEAGDSFRHATPAEIEAFERAEGAAKGGEQ